MQNAEYVIREARDPRWGTSVFYVTVVRGGRAYPHAREFRSREAVERYVDGLKAASGS